MFIWIEDLSCAWRWKCVSKVLVAIFRVGKARQGPEGAALVVFIVGYQLYPVWCFSVRDIFVARSKNGWSSSVARLTKVEPIGDPAVSREMFIVLHGFPNVPASNRINLCALRVLDVCPLEQRCT